MERRDYFLRRLLLTLPTFLCITFICFALCQFVPGGPVEQAIRQMRGQGGGGEVAIGSGAAGQISAEQREELRRHFGFDRPLLGRYWTWLVSDRVGLGMESYKYPNRTAWQLVRERLAVTLIFGIPGFLLSYLVCIPLGIGKALRDGSGFDVASSIVVFIGYAMPAFALGMLLKLAICGAVPGWPDLLPASGFVSDGYATLSPLAKALDIARHMLLPVACYLVGNFALLTLLMKNSLVEQISQDYVRTVIAKGGSVRRAVWRHALRNALIPIATGVGGVLTMMFAGAVLIERVFEIPGMGSLSIESIIGRDYPVFMAILVVSSVLALIGNIVSDLLYVVIDPRITFD
jgi:microcin C transport system permease protein